MSNTPKWTGYFKFVSPVNPTQLLPDSQDMPDAGTYANNTWYNRLVQGSASRVARYREYDMMDNDVEVARALDTIAEEMTGNNVKTGEVIDIDILTEEEKAISSTSVLTVKAALRRWCILHDFENSLFNIARVLVKYGDVFFKKIPNRDTWVYVHPKNVLAALVDQHDATKVLGWQIRENFKDAKSPNSGYVPTSMQQDGAELVPAHEIVRFTLNDSMSDTAPFGESVLRPAYRSFKQKELLEDAIIIYRIQRAPERRVFYVDVGKMPPQRVKKYLEGIKNEIRQKKIPTMNGGQAEIDSVYNPQSMCLALNTKIPLLDGRTVTLQEMIAEHNEGKQNWVYSVNPKNGDVAPGLVSWAGITQKNAETIKLTLDNGETIVCTPEHKFPVQGKGFVEAKDLTAEDSLFPYTISNDHINKKVGGAKYTKIYNPKTKGWVFVHRLVANFMKKQSDHNEMVFDCELKDLPKNTIHHKNHKGTDNSPNNLVFMNNLDHNRYHQSLCKNQEVIFSARLIERFEQLANENIYIRYFDLMEKLNSDHIFMEIYKQDNQAQKDTKYKIKTDKFRQKMFLVFIKKVGYKNWKEYQSFQVSKKIDNIVEIEDFVGNDITLDDTKLIQKVFSLVKNVSIHNSAIVQYLKNNTNEWDDFACHYKNVFKQTNRSIPENSILETVAKRYNYLSFVHMVKEAANFNHRVVKIEKNTNQDVGTLTIDQHHEHHDFHTFALSAGVFTKNSEDYFMATRDGGKGTRVETLPGGAGLGNLEDLNFFLRKVWRGLRVPASYMIEQNEGGQIWNDGKVGISYIQELRFALFVKRLQSQMENVLDVEFKKFLKAKQIYVDENMYRLRLPDPSNFGQYRQQELDNQLLGSYPTVEGISYISPRFAMKRFLQMTDEEIITNERMRREELGLSPDGGPVDYPKLYSKGEDTMGADGGFGGFGGGGTFDGGLGGAPGEMSPAGEPSGEDAAPTEPSPTEPNKGQ